MTLLATGDQRIFSNFGSLKSTEIRNLVPLAPECVHFSNFGSLKSTEIITCTTQDLQQNRFSNFGSLKSTEIRALRRQRQVDALSAISAR